MASCCSPVRRWGFSRSCGSRPAIGDTARPARGGNAAAGRSRSRTCGAASRFPLIWPTGPGMGAAALASMPDRGAPVHARERRHRPVALAAAMPQPVLVVQGGNDTSVPTASRRSPDGRAPRAAGWPRPGRAISSFPGSRTCSRSCRRTSTGPEAFGYPGETDARVAGGIDQWIRRLPA